jgi:hypothetical protein
MFAFEHLIGVDFTSTPSRRKPVTVARGRRLRGLLQLDAVEPCPDWAAFDALLARPGPWLGAFDFPFGLPRAFVDALALGTTAAEVCAALHARCVDRMAFRALVDAWGQGRPPGQRLLHRATDLALDGAGSTSPLQTRYVPVGFMYFEGLPRLLRAGLHLPGLHAGDAARVALEGYPGALAAALIGRRSYKNSDAADRLIARKDLVDALEQGRAPGAPRLRLGHALRESLVDDASGDRLDAVLCLMQAAAAATQPGHGLPGDLDPVEGWILGARRASVGTAAAAAPAAAPATIQGAPA